MVLAAVGLLALAASPSPVSASKAAPKTNDNPLCSRLGKEIQASSGAQMFCYGSQPTGNGVVRGTPGASFGPNSNAASPSEDVSPAGVQAYGQSEVSIAATGNYVVEAWNDATGFFSPCPSPLHKEELTGFGFSNDGGSTFVDQGGVPVSDCNSAVAFGDPSVEAYTSGGTSYFYISSLYDSPFFNGPSQLALNACTVVGSGSSATLSCNNAIPAASSSECSPFGFCSFLDKEFLAIDATRGLLYMSYTEFGIHRGTAFGVIKLAVCDIGNGAMGGTAASPVCTPGSAPTSYLTLSRTSQCENEGAYPAVDAATGDVYVAYEHNWATNFFSFKCAHQVTSNVVNFVDASCLTLPVASCSGPTAVNRVTVISMDAAFIPGYNRFPASDFPRIAVSDQNGSVSIVWNDARNHPLGDILLESYDLQTLSRVQTNPVQLNAAATSGGMNFMPALRGANPNGNLDVSWFSRTNANSTLTDVSFAGGVNPRTHHPVTSNSVVTTQSSDWNAVSSDIIPNFGDYTDNYVDGFRSYVAWSDGRIGEPQPFDAHR